MRFQTILGIGVVAILAYLVYEFFHNPTVQGAVASTASGIENAATGQLSDTQVSELVNQEAQGLVTASGGAMTLEQAQAQAQADISSGLNTNPPTYWDGVKAAFGGLL